MKKPLFALSLSLALCSPAHGQSGHRCAAEATKQAQLLLNFHTDAGERVGIDSNIRVLPPIRNPVNRNQQFDVLEVQGFVYKAKYRMRVIYAQLPGTCLLMGQEVLEQASP